AFLKISTFSVTAASSAAASALVKPPSKRPGAARATAPATAMSRRETSMGALLEAGSNPISSKRTLVRWRLTRHSGAEIGGAQRRFECFDNHPHYHYDPANTNVRIMLDPTVTGNPLRWTMTQLRRKLPAMLGRAGYEQIALQTDPSELLPVLDEVEARACEMAVRRRRTVRHNRGT